MTFRDTGHRLRLESHIQRLITAIDATPDVFLVTDADLRITFVNPAFQSNTGYGLEEVLGRADDFLRAPLEQEKVARLSRTGQPGPRMDRGICQRAPQRRNLPGRVHHLAHLRHCRALHGLCRVSERDITVRKHLQDELRPERDFVQSILQSLDGAIYSLDCEFRLTHANDGWRHLPAEHGGIRLTGAPEIGRALLDYVPDPARRAELQSLSRRSSPAARPRTTISTPRTAAIGW